MAKTCMYSAESFLAIIGYLIYIFFLFTSDAMNGLFGEEEEKNHVKMLNSKQTLTHIALLCLQRINFNCRKMSHNFTFTTFARWIFPLLLFQWRSKNDFRTKIIEFTAKHTKIEKPKCNRSVKTC